MKKKWQDDALGKTIPGAVKILVKMKLTLCIILFSFLGAMASDSYSQTTKLSLDLKNAKVKDALGAIENQSEFFFLYSEKLIDINREVNIEVLESTIEKILDKIFEGTTVNYTVKGRQIVLTTPEANNIVGTPSVSQQQKKVTGKVTDTSGVSLPGVAVVVKGTTTGVITDNRGIYSLSNIPENATLQFTFVGMTKQEVKVGTQNLINIVMSEETIGLEEVVAIGYGTVKKSNLTGSVSSVRSADIIKTGNASIGQLLAGRAAGLEVIQNSAQPGGGMEFLIRGQAGGGAGNRPLIVVDGFPITDFTEPSEPTRSNYGDYGNRSSLNSIDPNDIESIEVLKDASATAIYGSRAGHGVILITTKRGKAGNTKITYSGSTSFQNISQDYHMLNAKDFMLQTNRYEKESWLKKNKLGVYGPNGAGMTAEEFLAQPNKKNWVPIYSDAQIDTIKGTDWLGQILRTGVIKQHNVGISGGTEATKYMISMSMFDQKGIIDNTDLKRYTGRINLDQKLSKRLTTGINISFSQNSSNNAPISNSANEGSGIIRAALQFNPTLLVYDENGNFSTMPTLPRHANPLSLRTIQDNTTTAKFTASDYLEYEAFKNIKLRLNTGIDRSISKRNSYMPQTVPIGADEKGRATVFNSQSEDYLTELTANYTINKGGHNISLLGGYSWQVSKNSGSTMSQSNFITDALGYYLLGTGKMNMVGNVYGSKNEIASYFGRVNYVLKDKYLLTGTVRADGASQFAKNNKWGYFPSVALAWKMDNEPFMKSLSSVVSTLKPRVSFGQTGNANIGGNAFPHYGVIPSGYQFGDKKNYTNAVELFQLENKDLRWETTTELNFGLDMGFFNDRVNATLEIYSRVISDLLSTRALMSYHPVNTVAANIGKTQSQGYELTINSKNIIGRDFSWATDFTIFKYVDRWKEHDPSWKPSVYEKQNDYLRPYRTYLSDGLVKPGEVIPHMPKALPGQIKVKDINGLAIDADGFPVVDANGKQTYTGASDGKLDDADLVSQGSLDPDFNLGLNNTFNYKDFSLRIYLYGVLGKKLTNPLYGQYLAMKENKLGLNKIDKVKQSWANDNQDSKFPSYFVVENEYGWGDFFVENASFVRIKNITLNYRIKPAYLLHLVSEANIYVDVQNPYVFTKYTGVDPETDSFPAAYPNQKTYSMGINITF